MQIQTIEEKTGLDRATIRYYEQEGLIQPKRLQNGYRDYSEKHLQDLLKIKLLRELGLSLDMIQQLIEGNADLQSVMGNQLIVLKAHKEHIDDAEFICKKIVEDKVTYQSFEPNKYYNVIKKKADNEKKVLETAHIDYVYLESHPVRRFVGRYLDQILTSAILMLVFVVILRIRPFGKVQNSLLSIAATFVTMPINALFLCLLGTTPGKFAVGIFLKTPEGKNMSFITALRREWAVFRYGMGFTIPVYSWIRLYKSYVVHTEGRELEWDYECDTDVLYTEWDAKRWVYSVIVGALCAISIFYASMDAQLPKHRNKNLTLSQFVENYNDYAKQDNMITYLSEKGEWYTPDSYPNSVIVDVSDSTEYWQFITDDNQELERITIKIDSSSRLFHSSGKIALAIRTAILSQPNADILAVDDATRALSELVFMPDLETKQLEYCSVIVNMDFKQLSDSYYKTTVDIILP